MSMADHELSSFHQFLTERIASGSGDISPEEAVDQWRAEHPDDTEFTNTVQALREALADMEAGDRGVPLAEFDREFRARHGLSSES
jgi:hypothetical protein